MTLSRGGRLHPEETCISAGRQQRFPRNQAPYVVSSSAILWWANTAGKLRYFLNCIFKTFNVQNRLHGDICLAYHSMSHDSVLFWFFQCENFVLSRFLTLSKDIKIPKDTYLRIILSGFCHLAVDWFLLKGFKCFASAVPQQRKTALSGV